MKNGTAVDAETYPHFILRLKLLEEIQDTFGGESVKQCRTYSKPFRPNTETPKKVQQFSKKNVPKSCPNISYISQNDPEPDPTFGPKTCRLCLPEWRRSLTLGRQTWSPGRWHPMGWILPVICQDLSSSVATIVTT